MIEELARIDVNLLVALHALIEEASVTRAAARIGCGQPAMSQKLQRLRDALGDPLLIRHRRGMIPTERARALAGPLAEALRALNEVISPTPPFDPASARAHVRIGARTGPLSFFPALMARVARRAPGIDLTCLHVIGEVAVNDLLAGGDVDLIVQPRRADGRSAITRTSVERIDESLYARRLMTTRWLCVVRPDHPDIRGALDLQQFCDVGHILTSPRGDAYGLVDRTLERMGRRRRIAAVTQDFMLSWYLAVTTDLLLTTNQMIAHHLQPALPGQLLPPPIEMPQGDTVMLWHARSHDDPLHRWLRAELAETCAELMAAYSTLAL